MSEHKLTTGRVARLKLWIQQVLRWKKATSQARFTPHPRKPRLSKRGEPHPSWYTKKWTASRLKDRGELY